MKRLLSMWENAQREEASEVRMMLQYHCVTVTGPRWKGRGPQLSLGAVRNLLPHEWRAAWQHEQIYKRSLFLAYRRLPSCSVFTWLLGGGGGERESALLCFFLQGINPIRPGLYSSDYILSLYRHLGVGASTYEFEEDTVWFTAPCENTSAFPFPLNPWQPRSTFCFCHVDYFRYLA